MKLFKIFFLSMLLLSLSGCAVWTQALNKMGFDDEPQQQARPADQKPLAPKPLKFDVPAGVEISQRFELPPDRDGQCVEVWLGETANDEWIFYLNGKWWANSPKTRSAEIIEIRQVGGDDLIVIEQFDQPCGFPGAEEFKKGYSYRFVLVTGSGRPAAERSVVLYKPGNECQKLDFSGDRGSWVAKISRTKTNDIQAAWWIENHNFKYEFSTDTRPPPKKKKSKKLFGLF